MAITRFAQMPTLAAHSAPAPSASPRATAPRSASQTRAHFRRRATRLAALLALAQAPLPGQSTYEWSGTVSTAFADSANWSPATTPGSLDTARFAATPGSTTIDIFTTTLLFALDFTAAAPSHTLNTSGNTLVLGAGGLTNASASTQTISAVISVGSTQTWATTGTGLTDLTGGLFLDSGTTLTLDGSGTTALSSQIFGNGALAKTGPGLLTLAGNNSYSGGTTFAGGTTQLDSANALGTTGPLAFTGGTLRFTSANTSDYSSRFATTPGQSWLLDTNGQNVSLASSLSSTGGILTKLGAGTLTLNSANTYEGLTTVSAGTLQAAAAGALGTGEILAESAATLHTAHHGLDLARLQVASTGTVTTTGALTYSAATDHTVAATLAGTGATVQKSGPATLTLTSNNTHTGGTQVTGGTLSIAADTALGDASAPLSLNAATLATTATLTSTRPVSLGSTGGTLAPAAATTLTLGGNLNATGSLTVSGPGTLVLGGTNFLGSGVNLTAGTTQLDSADALGSSGTISFTGGTLRSTAANTADYSARFANTPGQAYSLDTNGQNLTLANALNSPDATLAKLGTGTLTLSADNTYSGPTTVSAGTLQLGAGGTTGNLASSAISLASGTTLAVHRSTDLSLPGDLTGAGGLTKLGTNTLTLTGDTAHTGPTQISAGTLALDRSTDATLSAPVSGAGTLVKLGANTLSVASSLDHSGGTTVSAGTIRYVGPGSASTIPGPVSVGPGSSFVTAPGIAPVTLASALSGAGSLDVGSTLTLAADSPSFTGPATVQDGIDLHLGQLGGTTGSLAGPVTLLGNAALSFNRADDQTHPAQISGTGRLFKYGAGELTLSAANPFTGLVLARQGTLSFTAPTAASGIYILNTGKVRFGATQTYSGLLADNDPGSPGAQVEVFNNATFTLATPATFQGSATVASGSTLALGVDQALPTATALTLAPGGTLDLATFTQTLGSLAGSGAVAGSGGSLRLGAGDATSTFAGSLASAAALEKIGSGTLTLTGAHTHTGPTTVTAGTLALGAPNRLSPGSGLDLASGTTLALNDHSQTIGSLSGAGSVNLGSAALTTGANDSSSAFSGTYSGTGSLTKSGTGLFILSGENTYSGGTTVSDGILRSANTNALPQNTAYTVNGGTLQLNGQHLTASSLSGAGGAAWLDAGSLTVAQSGNTTYAGQLVGSAPFAKSGLGTLTLSGAGSYTGTTTVSEGVLSLATTGSVAGPIAIAPSGTLAVARSGLAPFANPLSGTGTLTFSGPGAVLLTGNNSFTGTAHVTGGGLQIGAVSQLGAPGDTGTFAASQVVTSPGTTFAFDRSTATTWSGNLSGAGTFYKIGTGTLTLTGTSFAQSGGTQLLGGVLDFAPATPATFASAITGPGTLAKSGPSTLLLTANNTHTGGTTVSAGTLQLGDGGATGGILGDVFVAPGATLIVDRSDNSSFGRLTGAGAFVKQSAGTFFPGAASALTGPATISGGTLSLSSFNSLSATATTTVASGATLALNGNSQDLGALSGAGTVTLGSATLTLGATGLDSTFSGNLTGTLGSTLSKFGTGQLTLSGTNSAATYNLNNGRVVLGSTGALGNTGTIHLGGATLVATAANTTDYSARFSNAIGSRYNLDTAGQNITWATNLTSTGGRLTKSGAGDLTLGVSNTFNGPTTLLGGTLTLGHADALTGTSSITFFGGTLRHSASHTADLSARFATTPGQAYSVDTNGQNITWVTALGSADSTLTKLGSGTLFLRADSPALTGLTTISAGTLSLSNASGFGSVAGPITIASGATLQVARTFNLTLSSPISGAGSLLKTSSGALFLDGDHTFTGGTTINAGGIQIGVGTGSGSFTGDVALASGTTFAFNRTGSTTWGGNLSGTGTFSKLNTGTVALTGTSHAASAFNLLGGTLDFAGSSPATFSGPVSGVGTLRKSGSGTLAYTGSSLANTGGFVIDAGTLDLDSTAGPITISTALSGPGGLRKLGAGTATLTAANTHAGPTTITTGTLSLGNGGATGSVSGPVTIASGASLVVNRNNSLTLSSSISGAGSLLKFGPGVLFLDGDHTFTGGTTLGAGGIQVGVSTASGSFTGDVDAASGTTFAFDRTGSTTWGGNLSGGGTFFKINTGAVALTGTSYAPGGGTQLLGGTLDFAGSSPATFSGPVSGAGTLRKSGSGTLAYTGSSLANTGGFVIDAGTLDLASSGNTAASTALSGPGSLRQLGTGIVQLSGNNTFTGDITLAAGTLAALSANALGSTGTLHFSGGTLAHSAANTADYSARFSTAPGQAYSVNTDSQFVTWASGLSSSGGTLAKHGAGALFLTGENTFTGPLTIHAGGVQIGGPTPTPTGSLTADVVTGAGTTFAFSRSTPLTYAGSVSGAGDFYNFSTAPLTLTGPLTHAGATFLLGSGATILDRGATDYTLATALSGAGPLTKLGSGTLTLSADNTHSGPTTVSAGQIRLGAGGAAGGLAGPVSLASGASLVIDRSSPVTLAQVISGAGSLTQAGSGTTTLTGANTYAGGTTVTGGALLLGNGGSLPGAVSIASGASFGIIRGDTFTLAHTLTGAGAFTQSGSGTTVLTGSATHTGGTAVSAGTLQLGASDTSGTLSGPITIGFGASFAVARSDTFALANDLSGPGRLVQRGPGTLTLTGANTHSGGTVLEAGTTEFSSLSDFGSGSVTLAGGALRWAAGNTADLSTRLTPLPAGDHALDLQANDVTFATALSGTGGLAKSGTGALTLTADNSYAGTTTVSAGTLRLGTGGATGSVAGPISLATGTTLEVNRSADLTLASTLSGPGSLVKQGSGTLTLAAANAAFTGPTTVSAGTLRLINSSALAGDISLASGATFDFQRAGLYVFGTNISGPGSIVQTGSGVPFITGELTHTGGTTIHSGGIQIGAAGPTGSILGDVHLAAPSTTFAFDRTTDLTWAGSLTGAGTFYKVNANTLTLTGSAFSHTGGTVLAGGTVDFASSSPVTVPGPVSGGGALRKSGPGTLTLAADNGYTGGTTVTTGTLRLGSGGATGGIAGPILLSGPTTSLVVDRGTDSTLPGLISGTGSLTKLNTNRLTLAAANTFTGTTTISAGTLQLGNGSTSGPNAYAGSVGGPIEIASGATLAVHNASSFFALSVPISGAGGFEKLGSNTHVLNGTQTYTGPTHIAGGTLRFDGGTLFGAVTIASGATLEASRIGLYTFSANVSGAGGFAQTSSGVPFITGDLTHTGGTTISAGGIQIGAGGATGSIVGNVQLTGSGTTFAFDRSTDLSWGGNLDGLGTFYKLNTNTLTLTGSHFWPGGGTVLGGGTLDFAPAVTATVFTPLSGAGALRKSGPGILKLIANNTHTGGTTLAEGTLQLGDGGTTGSVPGPITASPGTRIVFNRSDNLTYSLPAASPARFEQRGPGQLTFATDQTYTGGTHVTGGTLRLGAGGTTGSVLGPISLQLDGTLALDRSDDLAFTNPLSGQGGFTKLGANTVTVTQTFEHTGPTLIAGGVLAYDTGADPAEFRSPLSGPGGFTKLGSGTLYLGAPATHSGPTLLSAGTLSVNLPDFLSPESTHTLASGTTLELIDGHTQTLGALAGSGTIQLAGSPLLVGANGADTTFSGLITGPGHLTKDGSGTLTLTTAQTYVGSTTVSAGTLVLGPSATLGASGNALNTTGGILDLGGTTQQVGPFLFTDATVRNGTLNLTSTPSFGPGFVHATLAGNVGATIAGPGTTVFSADNTYVGSTTVADGAVLQIGYGGTTGNLAGNLRSGFGTAGGHLRFDRSDNFTYTGSITGFEEITKEGAGTLTLAGLSYDTGGVHTPFALDVGTLALSTSGYLPFAYALTGAGHLVKTGAGTVALTGASTFTGPTTIATGQLYIGVGPVDDATFDSPVQIDSTGTLHFGRNNAATFASPLTGTGNLNKSGPTPLTLTADSSFSGLTQVIQGTLQVGAGGTTGRLGGDTFIHTDATYAIHRSDDVSLSRALSGPGTFRKLGANTLTYTGNGFQQGATALSGGALRFAQPAFLAVPGPISGPGAVIVGGLSFVRLTADQTYTGPTTIESGHLILGNHGPTGSLASSAIFFGSPNATLELTRTTDYTYAGNLTALTPGAGFVAKSGPGILTLTGSSFTQGATAIFQGTLAFAGPATVTGDIYGTGALAANGPGTLVLAGDNTYTGPTTVAADTTLQIGDGVSTPTLASSVTLSAPGATLAFHVGPDDTATYSAALTGPGSLHKQGSGTLLLDTDQTFTGTTAVYAGTLQLGEGGATGSLTGPLLLQPGTTLHLNHSNDRTLAQATGLHHLVKSGLGTLTLDPGLGVAGDTYIGGGTLRLGAADQLSPNANITLNNEATLDLANHALTLGDLGGAGTIALGTATLTLAATQGEIEFSGSLTGTGGLVKTGGDTLRLSGPLLHTGPTQILAGGLVLNQSNPSHALPASLAISAGASVRFATDGSRTYSGPITGAGNVTIDSDGGTFTLAGTHTYTGSTTARDGRLHLTGSAPLSHFSVESYGILTGTGTTGSVTVQEFGTLSPGASPGLLTVNGNLTLDAGSTTLIELGGTNRGFTYDAINISGSASFGGTLDVVFWAGWTPTGPASFQVFQATSYGGSFSNVSLPALPSNLVWQTGSLVSSGTLGLTAIPEPAAYVALLGLTSLGLAATRRRR